MPSTDKPNELNLEDIARICNVSRSTVSRVINNSPHVRERTRQRILAAIAEYNYVPNAAARSLVTQRTRVLGVYIPQLVTNMFSDPYFPGLLQAVTECANEHDYDVMLWLQGQALDEIELHQRVLDNRLPDGVILASTTRDDPLLKGLLERARAYVLNGRPWEQNSRVNYVDTDNQQGARSAVEHLFNLGRRRIATITGRLDMCAGYDRLIGYQTALRELGLSVDQRLIAEGNFLEASGYAGLQKLLPHQPDAIFCASDLSAMGALRAINEAGIRVPDDIALVGFDDNPFSQISNPPLTTIRQPVGQLGYTAAQGLIGLIEGTITPPYQVVMPTELIVRTSCGAHL